MFTCIKYLYFCCRSVQVPEQFKTSIIIQGKKCLIENNIIYNWRCSLIIAMPVALNQINISDTHVLYKGCQECACTLRYHLKWSRFNQAYLHKNLVRLAARCQQSLIQISELRHFNRSNLVRILGVLWRIKPWETFFLFNRKIIQSGPSVVNLLGHPNLSFLSLLSIILPNFAVIHPSLILNIILAIVSLTAFFLFF